MKALFIDPSVLLLAVGGEQARRDPCRRVVEGAARREVDLHLSVEGGREFLFHRLRRTRPELAVQEFDLLDKMVTWHAFDVDVLHRSRDLVAAGQAQGRDAVHAATALRHGFTSIVSCDADFDGIPGLRRIDPAREEWG